MSHTATIRRRSGRRSKDILVTLEKRPEDYVLGEGLTIMFDGREIPVCVEIPLDGKKDSILYVA